MAIKGRVIRLENASGIRMGSERRRHMELYKMLCKSNKSIEQLHEEVSPDFRGLVSLLEDLQKARKEGVLS